MKKSLFSIFSLTLGIMVFTVGSVAQDDRAVSAAGQNYVISAKAGGVNLIEGDVLIARLNGQSGRLLKTDSVAIGDRISTAITGKAEILLNPGSFVRLGGNSRFEFVSTDLDNLKLKLSAGSAILEIFASNELKVNLEFPAGTVEFADSGVFRIDILSDGRAKVSVWKGQFHIGEEKAEVKGGRTVVVGGTKPVISKFDRDNKDELDVWSQLRGKEAAKINDRLRRDSLRNSLMGAYGLGQWNIHGTLGVWVFDYVSGRWCFLPFGSGWRSPYGYAFGYDLYRCDLPRRIYFDPPPILPPVVVTPTTPTGAQIREERRQATHTPTFQRFESSQRNNGRGDNSGNNNNNGNTDNGSGTGIWTADRSNNDQRDSKPSSQPTFNPSPKSDPIIVMPSRSETKDVKDN